MDDPRYHGKLLLWTRIRAEVLWENKVCQRCGINPSSEVDHIKEIALGGDPFDKTNLQALCHRCHKEKTAEFLSKRMRSGRLIGKRLPTTKSKEDRTRLGHNQRSILRYH
ncbi:MAG: HNH endonuclease signature motif containing protein [Conexivisphaerales archaeon]|jgi:5-methylcytosine-specific restriction endonuclease McrA